MVLTQDDVLDYVNKAGPLLSINVAKHFNINTTYAGAYLSELVSKNKVMFTNFKIGTSPLYYTYPQREKLENFADKLGPTEKNAFDMLKIKKVLRETSLDTPIRLALRTIPDFAVSLIVNFQGKKELFWKYHLIDNNEAQELIKNILNPKPIEKIKEELKEEKKAKPEEKKAIEEKSIIEEKKVTEKPIEETIKPKEELIEKQKKLKEKEKEISKEKEKLEKELRIKVEHEHKELEKQRKEFLSQREELQKEKQELQSLMQELRHEREALEKLKTGEPKAEISEQKKVISINERVDKEKDEFFVKTKVFMEENNMKIKDYEIVKKGEISFVIEVTTALGSVDYYCIAKSKKRSNEGDLSTAYVKGQNKKLPTLYLSLGAITKGAQDMLAKEFKGMIVKKME